MLHPISSLDQNRFALPFDGMEQVMTREEAADQCLAILDTEFFAAMCEPVRVALIRALAFKGRSDIGSLAAGFPQDRSVIARHLQLMERAGLVRAEKVGRHQFFELDGPAILSKMEAMTGVIRQIVPVCCPSPP